MSNITVRYGQNLADVSIMATGSVEGLFDLCELNALMPDASLNIGQSLSKPEANDADMLLYLNEENVVVATGESYAEDGSGAFSSGFSLGFS